MRAQHVDSRRGQVDGALATGRQVFGYEGSTVEFFGRYLEVTVTFEEQGGKTLLVVHDQEALDAPIASGATVPLR